MGGRKRRRGIDIIADKLYRNTKSFSSHVPIYALIRYKVIGHKVVFTDIDFTVEPREKMLDDSVLSVFIATPLHRVNKNCIKNALDELVKMVEKEVFKEEN